MYQTGREGGEKGVVREGGQEGGREGGREGGKEGETTLMAAMCSGVSPLMFLRMVLAWAEEGVAGTGLSNDPELPPCCTDAE